MVGEEYKEQLLLAWDKEQDEKIEREQAVRFADIFKKLFKSVTCILFACYHSIKPVSNG